MRLYLSLIGGRDRFAQPIYESTEDGMQEQERWFREIRYLVLASYRLEVRDEAAAVALSRKITWEIMACRQEGRWPTQDIADLLEQEGVLA